MERTKYCEVCGAEFMDRSSNQVRRFCSDKCQARKWRKTNPRSGSESGRKWRAAHSDKLKEYHCQYYKANAQESLERGRKWRAANLEAARERSRKWRAAHIETARNSERRYRQTEAGKATRDRKNYKRRSLMQGAFVEHVDRQAIFERDNYTCQLCKKKVNTKVSFPDPRSPTLDHILPLSKGGTHEAKNVQLAHLGCNSRKHDTGVDQLRLLG